MSRFLLLLLASLTAAPTAHAEGCPTAREFITALEFLRSEKSLSVPEDEARKAARSVAAGCAGAAGRFIRVTRLLSLSGVSGKDALALGLELAARGNADAETFAIVFQRAFLAESLDLDLPASIGLARSLSLESGGDSKTAREDFEALLDFCASERSLALARPACGSFAADLSRAAQSTTPPWSGGMAKTYLRLFRFLTSDPDGPAVTSGDALGLAGRAVRAGPSGPENLMQGFRYAASDRGLNLPREGALRFAAELALASPAASEQK